MIISHLTAVAANALPCRPRPLSPGSGPPIKPPSPSPSRRAQAVSVVTCNKGWARAIPIIHPEGKTSSQPHHRNPLHVEKYLCTTGRGGGGVLGPAKHISADCSHTHRSSYTKERRSNTFLDRAPLPCLRPRYSCNSWGVSFSDTR